VINGTRATTRGNDGTTEKERQQTMHENFPFKESERERFSPRLYKKGRNLQRRSMTKRVYHLLTSMDKAGNNKGILAFFSVSLLLIC
jgi:hypothetical protein